jgi:hypothetical protein
MQAVLAATCKAINFPKKLSRETGIVVRDGRPPVGRIVRHATRRG